MIATRRRHWVLAAWLMLLTALLAAWVLEVAAQPAAGPAPDNPLRRHRERLAGATAPAVLAGRITAVDQGRLVTDLSAADLDASGFQERDPVSIRIQGKTLLARILSGADYREIIQDQAARDALDVDVLAVVEATGPVVVLALDGDLVDWLRVRPGMPVVLQRGRAAGPHGSGVR